MHEVVPLFSDKETRLLEAALLLAVPLSIVGAVLLVSLTFGWLG